MTVDDFLWKYVRWNTPVVIVDAKNNELDSFIYTGAQCAWKGNWKVRDCTIEDGRLKIRTTEY